MTTVSGQNVKIHGIFEKYVFYKKKLNGNRVKNQKIKKIRTTTIFKYVSV